MNFRHNIVGIIVSIASTLCFYQQAFLQPLNRIDYFLYFEMHMVLLPVAAILYFSANIMQFKLNISTYDTFKASLEGLNRSSPFKHRLFALCYLMSKIILCYLVVQGLLNLMNPPLHLALLNGIELGLILFYLLSISLLLVISLYKTGQA